MVKRINVEVLTIAQVLVVNEFLDAFLEELHGMPQHQKIKFCIYLIPDTQPIYVPPYLMAPTELKEQLQDLLDKVLSVQVLLCGVPQCYLQRRRTAP